MNYDPNIAVRMLAFLDQQCPDVWEDMLSNQIKLWVLLAEAEGEYDLESYIRKMLVGYVPSAKASLARHKARNN